jgi:hypothetical protein
MKQIVSKGAALLLAFSVSATQGIEWPQPLDIFNRHLQAIGGAEALRQAENLAFTGEADLVPLKAKGRIEFLVQAPDRFFFEFKYHHAFFGKIRVPFVGKRQLEWGFDGTNGWSVDLERKVEPLVGSEQAVLRALLDKFSPLYFGRKFYLTRTLGVETFAEHNCYRVLIVLPSGEHAFEYYDTLSGLAVGAIYPFEINGGMLNLRMTYGDFRRIDKALRLPFQIDLEFSGQRYVLRASEIRTHMSGLSIPASKLKSPAPAQPGLKPAAVPAAMILEHYFAALGGAETIRQHSSMHLSGEFQIPGRNGFTKPIDIFSSAPNRLFIKLQLPKALHRQGCDGEHYWRATGDEIHFAESKDLEQRLAQVNFLAELHEADAFRSIETLGVISVDGRDCYQLLLVRKNGEILDELYDVETGLLQGRRSVDEANNGSVSLIETFTDYRRIGNRLLPMRQTIKLPGQTEILTFSTAEWDNVPASTFELPPEIKSALANKASK